MDEYTTDYVSFVMEQFYEMKDGAEEDPLVLIEQRLDFSSYVPDGFGTGDAVLLAPGKLHVIDFKYGQGVLVEAEHNSQMMLYALAALKKYSRKYKVKRVSMSIFQPRRENVSTWTITATELRKWAKTVLIPKAKAAYNGDGEYLPGDHCQFCKAAAKCRARAEEKLKLAQREFSLPPLLTDEEIEEILVKLPDITKWANELMAYATDAALFHGKEWKGFKVVEGRSVRKYSDEDAVAEAANKAGYRDIYIQKLIGGTDAHQYTIIGIIFGSLAAVMTLLCGLFTKERIKPKRAEKYSFSQFVNLFKNRPWVYLTLAGLCTNFFNGFRYAVAGYIFSYCLGGNVTLGSFIINFSVFMAFGEVTCMIFGALSPAFTKRVGSKKKSFIIASAICVVFSVAFFFVPMSPRYIWLMIALVVLTSVGVGIYSPLLWSMYADVADYATEKFGTSSTGLIFSSGTMAQKLGGAISGSLIALFLGLAGAEMIRNDVGNLIIDPATVTDSVRTMVWSLFSLIPAVIALAMGWLAFKFPIKK